MAEPIRIEAASAEGTDSSALSARGLTIARQAVERLGGRYSVELGIDVDRSEGDVERWALAATLFGNRISTAIAERTYRALASAGVSTIADAGKRSWEELVELLDRGGYVRYDFRTATRLRALADSVAERHDGRISSLGEALRESAALEAALDALPGWGPVTVHLFLRELRGVWPGAEPALDGRAVLAAQHLGLLSLSGDPLAGLRRLASSARLDIRDLEAALVRLALAHGSAFADCPGGEACRGLEPSTGRGRRRLPRRDQPGPGDDIAETTPWPRSATSGAAR